MDAPRIVKSIIPHTCPSCQKLIFICYTSAQPALAWVHTNDVIQEAKKKLKEQVTLMEMDAERKKDFLQWADNENTFFGPEEVPMIVEQLRREEAQINAATKQNGNTGKNEAGNGKGSA